MAKKRFRKVKYKVTGAFGDSPVGEIREAFVIIEDSSGSSALIFHPKNGKYLCASIEMADQQVNGTYISSNQKDSDSFGYVNIEGQADLDALVRNVRRLKYRDNGG